MQRYLDNRDGGFTILCKICRNASQLVCKKNVDALDVFIKYVFSKSFVIILLRNSPARACALESNELDCSVTYISLLWKGELAM